MNYLVDIVRRCQEDVFHAFGRTGGSMKPPTHQDSSELLDDFLTNLDPPEIFEQSFLVSLLSRAVQLRRMILMTTYGFPSSKLTHTHDRLHHRWNQGLLLIKLQLLKILLTTPLPHPSIQILAN